MVFNFKYIRKNLKYDKVKDQWTFHYFYDIHFINTPNGKPRWSKRRILKDITFAITHDYKDFMDITDDGTIKTLGVEEDLKQLKKYLIP